MKQRVTWFCGKYIPDDKNKPQYLDNPLKLRTKAHHIKLGLAMHDVSLSEGLFWIKIIYIHMYHFHTSDQRVKPVHISYIALVLEC